MQLDKVEKMTTETVRFKICVPFLAYCAPFRNKANFKTNTVLFNN